MKPFKSKTGKYADVWIAACGFLAIVVALSIIRFPFLFQTNDDVVIKAILSGDITGTPDAHVIYPMYVLGVFLKTLYRIVPNVCWYDGFVLFLHLAMYLLLMLRVGRLAKRLERLPRVLITLGMGGLLFALDYTSLVIQQYTVLAAVLAGMGLFYYVTQDALDYSEDKEQKHTADLCIVLVALVLCLWIRRQVFFMAMPLFGVAFFYRLGKKNIKRDLLLIGLLAGITGLSFLVEGLAYRGEWKSFKEYNELRTDVYDYYQLPAYELQKDSYDAMGIDAQDLFPMAEGDLGLFEDYLKSEMKELSDISYREWKSLHIYSDWSVQRWEVRRIIKETLQLIFHEPVQPIGTVIAILFPLSLVGFLFAKRWKAALLIVPAALYEGVLVAYFIFRGRLIGRVAYGLYFLELCLLLGLIAVEISKKKTSAIQRTRPKNKALSIVAVIGFVLVLGFDGFMIPGISREYAATEGKIAEWEKANDYFATHPQNVYYLKTSSFASYSERMFTIHTMEKNNFVRLGTWISASPLQEEQMERIGEKTWERILTDDNVYYVQDSTIGTEWMNAFWQGNGYDVEAKEEETISLSDNKKMSVISLQ